MKKRCLVALAVLVLAACSGNSNKPQGGGAGGDAGQGSGDSDAGEGPGANGASGGSGVGKGGATSTGGTSTGVSGSVGTGGGAVAGMAGSAGTGTSGSAGSAGGPPIPEDAGSGACHDYTPCGGDIVGTWNIEVCADPPLMGLRAFCPAATETVTMTGSADIRADGTMSTILIVTSETSLPASCVAQLGACGEPGAFNVLADCTPGAEGTCSCSSVTENQPSDATYTTTPDGLLAVVREGDPSYSYYCRDGEELWMRGIDQSSGRITVLHLTKP